MRSSLPVSILTLALAIPLLGCQSLLPYQRNSVESPWQSFDEAKAAFEAVEIGSTTRTDLATMGFDPYTSYNVEIVTYIDIFRQFWGVEPDQLDPGIRDCLAATVRCVGLDIQPLREFDEEYGNFWLNFFEFRTQTVLTGWQFNSTLVLVDDTVVYKLWDGNPVVRKKKEVVRPLGPLQNLDIDFRISFP
ncbi:MAG: hypothetical protein JRH01_18915 [Deltaproteobacteria bacterium]|nr:hypothetical protein [Deltaproteobacteria bacterium]